jgi:glycosyltransferase involved in cell wall biosynthesis
VRFAYAWWLQAWIGKGLAMHFPSQALCDLYRRHGWARCFGAVRVERNVVAPFDTESPVSADIEELMSRARERGTRVWGFVGYMTESKGPDVALRAAARCTQPGELWMVGDGPERLALQAWAERHMPAHVHVRWLGQRPRHELFALLASMRVLLVPSLVWENCPGVVLEAQAVGTRVLGSDAGGFVELLPSADRLPPGDVAAWARAMCA